MSNNIFTNASVVKPALIPLDKATADVTAMLSDLNIKSEQMNEIWKSDAKASYINVHAYINNLVQVETKKLNNTIKLVDSTMDEREIIDYTGTKALKVD